MIKASENKQIFVAPDSLVCESATVIGHVTIGSKTIVHPKARIIAKDGPIVIGEGNLIEENCSIINRNPPGVEGTSTLTIGKSNVFEIGSEFEGKSIGNNNIIETRAKVGVMTTLSNGCVIGATCSVNTKEVLEDRTVIYGENCARRKMAENPPNHDHQSDFLKKILPNYHHFVKPKLMRP